MQVVAPLSPIKVDEETDRLVSHAAHFLDISKKDVVAQAVREYISTHRDIIAKATLDSLALLDGSERSAVKLLSGASDSLIDSLGGMKN